MSKLESGGGDGAVRARPKTRNEFGSRMSVLSNPDYLLEGFAEKKCHYVGVIRDIPTSADVSDRSYLLAIFDEKRTVGQLPWNLGAENQVSITISAYNMKILKDDRDGVVLHRFPIHEIAAVSYINDDHQHLVFVQAGDANAACCPCYVLSFSKRADAEEVCTILQQAFQLVYTEATMEHFNESINAGERGLRGSRTSLMLVPRTKSPVHLGASPPKMTNSSIRPQSPPTVPTLVEETNAEEQEEPVSAVELVQDYMERLHKLLNFEELRLFATLLKRYREDLEATEFLEKLKKLYGKQREFLIPDMNSFIPEEDIPIFEKFLSDNNLRPPNTSPTQVDDFSVDSNREITTDL